MLLSQNWKLNNKEGTDVGKEKEMKSSLKRGNKCQMFPGDNVNGTIWALKGNVSCHYWFHIYRVFWKFSLSSGMLKIVGKVCNVSNV